MPVYKVTFLLEGQVRDQATYIHASDPIEALQKLASRFLAQTGQIKVVAFEDARGKFVVGSEDMDFAE